MSIRDALPFKIISAVSLRIELLFFKASWPNVPSIVLEPLRGLIIFSIIFLEVVMLANPFGCLIEDLHMRTESTFMAIYLLAPVYGPIFCFLRPTTRQFPRWKEDLRVVCAYSERVKFSDLVVYVMIFLGLALLRLKYSPQTVLVWLLITAPLLVSAFKAAWDRYFLSVRASRLSERLTSSAWKEQSNIGSWSERFTNSYFLDVLFFSEIVVFNIFLQ